MQIPGASIPRSADCPSLRSLTVSFSSQFDIPQVQTLDHQRIELFFQAVLDPRDRSLAVTLSALQTINTFCCTPSSDRPVPSTNINNPTQPTSWKGTNLHTWPYGYLLTHVYRLTQVEQRELNSRMEKKQMKEFMTVWNGNAANPK